MTTDPPLTADSLSDDPAEAGRQLLEQGAATIAAVNQLRVSIDAEARQQRQRKWVKLVLVLVLIGVLVDNRLQLESLKRTLCPIVTASITRPGAAPPVTQHGRDVEQSAIELAGRLGCAVLPR
jgi:hypothetical protein